ncbi:MAG TPA: efflux RND transporter periplasmic adaptor subunit [Verrucomicrobiae bacterium]|nr:efflux RND transporter periplasmic adaptor subunit [Verrucomicrobiae bacterium]
MKRRRIRILVGLLIIGAAAVGVWLWRTRNQAAAAGQLVLFGNVDIRQVQLAFNDSERIVSMLVQEGDRFRAGQLLATLDTRRFEANVADQAARLAAQREVVARLDAGNRPEEIRKVKADMEAAKADLQNAELTFKRANDLHAQGVVAPQDYDDARAALDVATARLAAAKETYDLMVIGPRQEDIAAAKATLKANEAQLDLAQQDLANAKLYAPTNGVIEARLLEPGDMASPQKPVFTLALDDPLWVRAYVAETDLGKIRLGMKATLTTDSFPGKQYDGWIGFISPTAEFTPKTVETSEVRTKLVYQVRVFVRNPQGELRLGMPAVVTVPLNQPSRP